MMVVKESVPLQEVAGLLAASMARVKDGSLSHPLTILSLPFSRSSLPKEVWRATAACLRNRSDAAEIRLFSARQAHNLHRLQIKHLVRRNRG